MRGGFTADQVSVIVPALSSGDARRTVIVQLVADLARVYVGEDTVIAPSDLPGMASAFGNLARKYFPPPPPSG